MTVTLPQHLALHFLVQSARRNNLGSKKALRRERSDRRKAPCHCPACLPQTALSSSGGSKSQTIRQFPPFPRPDNVTPTCPDNVTAYTCLECGVTGWRQSAHLLEEARKLFQRVRAARQRKGRKGRRKVQAYLRMARLLVARAEQSLAQLAAAGAPQAVREEVEGYVGHARRQIDQIDRRVLQGQRIPHEEKVFSIFEPHTRWCAKGKAGVAVELGVPVSVVECEQQFVLHWQVMWEGEDVDVACPLVAEAQELYPCLAACSFDKGFHSPANRERLDAALELNALPRKGRLSKADREREGAPAFRAARRAHAAVESAINNLEQRGLGRVRARGADGFERMVVLAVLAGNLHRIGLVLQRAERARLKRKRAKRKRAALRLAA